MAKVPATTSGPPPTDGGVVLTLFLMVAAITFAIFYHVLLYVGARYPKERNERRLVRLLSGTANMGNGVVHALLIAVLYANRHSPLTFYVSELEEGFVGACKPERSPHTMSIHVPLLRHNISPYAPMPFLSTICSQARSS